VLGIHIGFNADLDTAFLTVHIRIQGFDGKKFRQNLQLKKINRFSDRIAIYLFLSFKNTAKLQEKFSPLKTEHPAI
jgi:hypothetical protein